MSGHQERKGIRVQWVNPDGSRESRFFSGDSDGKFAVQSLVLELQEHGILVKLLRVDLSGKGPS